MVDVCTQKLLSRGSEWPLEIAFLFKLYDMFIANDVIIP